MAGEVIVGYDGQEGAVAALRTATGDRRRIRLPAGDRVRLRPAPIGGEVADLAVAVHDIGTG